jgi:hypothetical protein
MKESTRTKATEASFWTYHQTSTPADTRYYIEASFYGHIFHLFYVFFKIKLNVLQEEENCNTN